MTIKNLLECDVLSKVILCEYKGKGEDGKVIEEWLWTSEDFAGLKDVPSKYTAREVLEIRSGYYICEVGVATMIIILVKEA